MTCKYRQISSFLVVTVLLQNMSKSNGNDIAAKKQHFFKTKHSLHSERKKTEENKPEIEKFGKFLNLPMIGSGQVSSAAVIESPLDDEINESENGKVKDSKNALLESR